MTEFPSDDILIARGKYSTLNSQRRELLKKLQQDALSIANTAHRVLRVLDGDVAIAQFEADELASTIAAVNTKLTKLAELAPLLADLRPQAWGEGKDE